VLIALLAIATHQPISIFNVMTNLEFPNSFTVPSRFLRPIFELFLDIPLFPIFPRNSPLELINLSSVSRAKSSYLFRGIGEIFTGFAFGILGVLEELLEICLGELKGVYCLSACHAPGRIAYFELV
jgi:hypothetical protein